MRKTYELKELATLTTFTVPYCKMVLKGLGVDPNAPIDEADAARMANKLKRPWPPAEVSAAE